MHPIADGGRGLSIDGIVQGSPVPRKEAVSGMTSDEQILVEVLPNEFTGDLSPVRKLAPEHLDQRLPEVARVVTSSARHLRDYLEDGLADEVDRKWAVDQVEVSFEMTLMAEAGILVTRAAAGATFTARVTFRKS